MDAARRPGFLDLFSPERPLGRGGMGEVWQVRHRASGEAFAVKFARVREASSERDRLAFEREVRAQARLHHPRVLGVLAFGELDAPISEAGLEQPAGARWCAFECVQGGALGRETLDGRALRLVLLRVLDALAHCHALGLAHLDLKPENLLWRHDPTDVVLADFGIAQLMGRQEKVTGTPAYMAPEQWLGGALDARTDLYALGCLAWRLAVGAPPFLGPPIRVRELHCKQPLPSTGSPALDGWIERLCEKDPGRRFQSAAAAADALPDRLLAGAEGQLTDTHTLPLLTALLEPDDATAPAPAPVVGGLRPVPPSWRAPKVPLHSPAAIGLGELGVREVPVLGREPAQDALWEAARAVAAGEGARLLVVVGPAGSGRSRLLRWIRVRLRELDAALTLDGGVPCAPDVPLGLRIADDADDALPALAAEIGRHRVAGARLLVVAAARADTPLPDGAIPVEIGPLSVDAALALALAWVALTPTDAAELVARAGGLPGPMAWELETRVRAGGVVQRRDGVALVGPMPRSDAPLTDDEQLLIDAIGLLPLPEAARAIEIAERAGAVGPRDALWTLLRRGLLREEGALITRSPRCPPAGPPGRALLLAARDTASSAWERALHASAIEPDPQPLAEALADPALRFAGPVCDAVLARAPAAFDAAGLASDHPARAAWHVARAYRALDRGDLPTVERAVDALRAIPGADRELGRGLTALTEALGRVPALDRAWDTAREARERLAGTGTVRERVLASTCTALVALNRFDWDAADRALAEAEALPGLTPDDAVRIVPWRRALLASRGEVREALAMSLRALEENPGYHGLRNTVPVLCWELREPETALAFASGSIGAPETIRKIVRTMTALCQVALGRWEDADAATLTPDPGYSESTRRHVRLVCAAPHVEMPFDLLLMSVSGERPPRMDDLWDGWLLRTAGWRARQVGLVERATRAEALADARLALLPPDVQARLPPAGPFNRPA